LDLKHKLEYFHDEAKLAQKSGKWIS